MKFSAAHHLEKSKLLRKRAQQASDPKEKATLLRLANQRRTLARAALKLEQKRVQKGNPANSST